MQLKNKPIADYDLLEKVFGTHKAATGQNIRHAVNIEEGSGDSSENDAIRFSDPMSCNQSPGMESHRGSSRSK